MKISLEEAKNKFREWEMSIIFMDMEDVIDCSGITFEEWIKANNIEIEQKK